MDCNYKLSVRDHAAFTEGKVKEICEEHIRINDGQRAQIKNYLVAEVEPAACKLFARGKGTEW